MNISDLANLKTADFIGVDSKERDKVARPQVRHLAPENLRSLQSRLGYQLEVLRVSHHSISDNLKWDLPKTKAWPLLRPVNGKA